jgi:hypothetical protein
VNKDLLALFVMVEVRERRGEREYGFGDIRSLECQN